MHKINENTFAVRLGEYIAGVYNVELNVFKKVEIDKPIRFIIPINHKTFMIASRRNLPNGTSTASVFSINIKGLLMTVDLDEIIELENTIKHFDKINESNVALACEVKSRFQNSEVEEFLIVRIYNTKTREWKKLSFKQDDPAYLINHIVLVNSKEIAIRFRNSTAGIYNIKTERLTMITSGNTNSKHNFIIQMVRINDRSIAIMAEKEALETVVKIYDLNNKKLTTFHTKRKDLVSIKAINSKNILLNFSDSGILLLEVHNFNPKTTKENAFNQRKEGSFYDLTVKCQAH